MHKFKDKTGQEWSIELTIASARRCRDIAGADFFSTNLGELTTQLGQNAELLVNTIWAIVKPEAEKTGITADDFAGRFVGQTIVDATEALIGELCLFTPSPKVGETLREINTRTKAIVEQAATLSLEKIRSGVVEQAAMAQVKKQLDQVTTAGASSTSSPASSASAPKSLGS